MTENTPTLPPCSTNGKRRKAPREQETNPSQPPSKKSKSGSIPAGQFRIGFREYALKANDNPDPEVKNKLWRNVRAFVDHLHLSGMSDTNRHDIPIPAPHANWKIPRTLEPLFRVTFTDTHQLLTVRSSPRGTLPLWG